MSVQQEHTRGPRSGQRDAAAPDLLVAGGGVIGLSVAMAAAARGATVTVIDPGAPGAASAAAAGLLLGARVRRTPWNLLYEESVSLYPGWLGLLAPAEGGLVRLHRGGAYRTVGDSVPPRGGPSGWLLPGRLQPDEAVVNPVLLLGALRATCRLLGVVLTTDALSELSQAGSLVCGTASGRRLTPGGLVIACGVWSQQVLQLLGINAGVRPQRGQMEAVLRVGPGDWNLHLPDGRFVVPRGGWSVVGATASTGNWHLAPSKQDRAALLRGVAAPLLAEWVGLRPLTRDRWPLVGWVDQRRRIAVCTGHGKLGIGLAPWSGEAVAALVAGEPVSDAEKARLQLADPWRHKGMRRTE